MKPYLVIRVNEGNPPTIEFRDDKDAAVATAIELSLEMGYNGDSIHLNSVDEDGTTHPIGEVYRSDGEFYNPANKRSWWGQPSYPMNVEMMDAKNETSLKDFLSEAFSG